MYRVGKAPGEPSPDRGSGLPAAAMPGGSSYLTPEQVARLLGGEIIASYASTIPARQVAYGPRDAITVLMAHGHQVALRDGAYVVDGERVPPEVLARLAAELEPAADDAAARAADAPGTGS
jgi:hypothetical protein